jgi:alpha-beta hydrolase superfamily lysophospholipase
MRQLIGHLLVLFVVTSGISVSSADEQKEIMIPDRDFLTMSDGEKLVLRSWLPSTGAGAVIVALHGINDYHHAFSIPASYLAARGIAVYAYDQRGHGTSPQRGRWAGTGVLARDAREAIKLISDRHDELPVYILGDSMGGAVAIISLTGEYAPKVSGLILVAPAVRGGRHINIFLRAVLDVGAFLTPSFSLSSRWSGVTLSDNDEAVAAIRSDPLVMQKTRVDTIRGVVHLMDEALEASSKLDNSILLLYGLKDEIVPKGAVCDFLDRLREKPVAAFYPEGYHLLLRDNHRERVLRDIISWLSNRDTPLPSGLTYRCP